MNTDDLKQALQAAFHPAAAVDFDARVRLQLGLPEDSPAPALTLTIHHGVLDVAESTPGEAVDFTLFFADAEQALALLTGQADPVAAFMAHEFRADGYLIWVFSVLAMFR